MAQKLEPKTEASFTFAEHEPFRLMAGDELSPVTLSYAVYGDLNLNRDNAILVCHALSGNARVAEWWPEMIGPGRALDTTKFCIICINVLGSCYGSTGPLSIDPRTGRRFAQKFPLVNVNDLVRSQAVLIEHLGISKLHAVIGGSIGGMQAIEWATAFPERVEHCIAIGATPLSALGLAINHLQRDAIHNDPAWQGGAYDPDNQPVAGQGDDPWSDASGRFDVAGYLDYQGRIFTERFDANSYLSLTKTMDLFDLAYPGEVEHDKLANVKARMLLVGISTDWLFPAPYVRLLSERLLDAGVDVSYAEFDSDHGHDAFLADADRLGPIIEAELGISSDRKNLELAASLHGSATGRSQRER